MYEANPAYLQTERVDSGSYWFNHLELRSASQYLACMDSDISRQLHTMALPEMIHRTGVAPHGETSNCLDLTVTLEADDEREALETAAGVALVALEAAGVELPQLMLDEATLVSGERLHDDRLLYADQLPCSRDPAYRLSSELYGVFTALHASLTRQLPDNLPATAL